MRERFEVILAGGGTGGHLFPALAVADELKRRRPDTTIGFVGSRDGLENRLVPAAGYPLWTLPLSGLKGAGAARRMRAAAAAAVGTVRCAAWMAGRGIRLVVGAGGFASGPAVLAARVTLKKTMLLEQNHFPGATNRALARGAHAVCLPGPDAAARIGGRRFVVGNPVRPAFAALAPLEARPDPTLLAFGGSRGARSLNRALVRALPALAARAVPPRIVHQTGPADHATTRESYANLYPAERFEVVPFLDDMPARMETADLVLARSGAGTIAELAAAGRPAILVPYPHAADDHQRYNAQALVDAGAAQLVPDAQLADEEWIDALTALLDDADARVRMGRAARTLARADAAARIVDLAEALLDGRPWPFAPYGEAEAA
ncbi:MAG: undecaprenyldiphospho-muramoylpentapeptide beta-N-acetylglucosaminyltransferase [Planctomycetota bacterium]|nr:undecaprenyldiphospho-muramoylpentapeptide beta-N-acetylglucosaminyltransferase [Planctomycetota bacterium]